MGPDSIVHTLIFQEPITLRLFPALSTINGIYNSHLLDTLSLLPRVPSQEFTERFIGPEAIKIKQYILFCKTSP